MNVAVTFAPVPSWARPLPPLGIVARIQAAVARHYGLRVSDMKSSRRARSEARPRQVAMYLARQHSPRSLPEIGRLFGDRDHTTVIHAIRVVTKRRAEDADLDAAIRAIEAML